MMRSCSRMYIVCALGTFCYHMGDDTKIWFNMLHVKVNLVNWLKDMVGDRKAEQVVDPRMPEVPPAKALKRVLLVALRCVDPDALKRPKMGHIVHMLEMDEMLPHDVCRALFILLPAFIFIFPFFFLFSFSFPAILFII